MDTHCYNVTKEDLPNELFYNRLVAHNILQDLQIVVKNV
jgi:hypothetical protein